MDTAGSEPKTTIDINDSNNNDTNDDDGWDEKDKEKKSLLDVSMSKLMAELEPMDKPKVLTRRVQVNIYIVYFSVFLDNMGVSIVQPILPFYAESFDANSFQLGMLYSSYSLMATFATIFMAKMSDKVGRRPMIIFSLFGTMTGFLLTGFAWNYESLLAFRFYTGAFGGSFSVAQAYMTDVCPPNLVEKYLAGIGGTMAIAFIIGPLLGGALAKYGLSVPFFASAIAGAVGFLIACIWLQESYFPKKVKAQKEAKEKLEKLKKEKQALIKSHEHVQTDEDDEDDQDKVPLTSTDDSDETDEKDENDEKDDAEKKKKTKIPVQVWLVLTSYFLATIGWCTFTSMFAQYLMDEFGLETTEISLITVIIGTVYVISNIVIFTALAKVIGIYWLACAGLALFAVSLGLCPVSGEIWGMLVFMCLGVGIGNGVLMPCMSAMGADFANDDNRGSVLGWITVGNQAAFVVGPLIMGALYAVEPDYIFYVGAGFVAAGFIPAVLLIIIWPETRHPKKYKKDEVDDDIQQFIDHPETWSYVADKPSYSDYHKLGKQFGQILIKRGYRWKTFYPKMVRILDLAFPPIRTDNWNNYYDDCRFLRARFEQSRWDFDHVRDLQLVSFMGESKVVHTLNKH